MNENLKPLTLDELKEFLRLAFNRGVSVGKKIIPLDQRPMGSKITPPVIEFDRFYKELIEELTRK